MTNFDWKGRIRKCASFFYYLQYVFFNLFSISAGSALTLLFLPHVCDKPQVLMQRNSRHVTKIWIDIQP